MARKTDKQRLDDLLARAAAGARSPAAVSPEIAARARKVLALCQRGATPGERAAATARLSAMAATAGVTIAALRRAI